MKGFSNDHKCDLFVLTTPSHIKKISSGNKQMRKIVNHSVCHKVSSVRNLHKEGNRHCLGAGPTALKGCVFSARSRLVRIPKTEHSIASSNKELQPRPLYES